MMRVLIIEPHGDDALISCSTILRNAGEVDILTLTARSSSSLREHLSNISEVAFLEGEDYHWDNRPVNHHQVNKWHKQGLNTFAEYMDQFDGNEEFYLKVEKSKEQIKMFLGHGTHDGITHYDAILAPLGVVHPFHCVVRRAVEELLAEGILKENEVVFYSEGPYKSTKYGGLLERDAIALLRDNGLELRVPADTDWSDTKEHIYRKVYPTEINLFRFTYDQVIVNEEVFIGSFETLRKIQEVIPSEDTIRTTSEI